MSSEIYTVSLESETAERLKAIAKQQGLPMDTVLQQAVADYLEAWETHMADLAEDDREALPWLNGQDSDA